MNKVGIKTYRLDKFPANAKVSNQGDRIKRFELTYNKFDQVYNRLMQEIQKVYNEESDKGKGFKLYWKDEENDLILIDNDADFQTALENNKLGEVIKVYIIDFPLATNHSKSEFSTTENSNKRNQTHPGIRCNECNSNIYGLRHRCRNCFNYSICDDCKNKVSHFNSHTFEIIESKYGFLTCLDCKSEMPNSFCVCKDCPNRNQLGIYPVCPRCMEKNHNGHSCLNIKTSDLNRLRQKLLDDLENQVNKDEESKIHYGIQCFSCKRDGVSYKSTLFKSEHVCLCVDCFIQGAFKNMLSFSKITSDDAETQRKQSMFVPNMFINTLNLAMGHGQAMHQATMGMINSIGAAAAAMAGSNGTGVDNGNSAAWASGNGFHGAWATSNGPNGPQAGFF